MNAIILWNFKLLKPYPDESWKIGEYRAFGITVWRIFIGMVFAKDWMK